LALPLASQNFKVQQERDYIMSRIFEAFKNQEEEIHIIAMQSLVEIAR
jgi:bacterioferritin (cytochrome b1)